MRKLFSKPQNHTLVVCSKREVVCSITPVFSSRVICSLPDLRSVITVFCFFGLHHAHDHPVLACFIWQPQDLRCPISWFSFLVFPDTLQHFQLSKYTRQLWEKVIGKANRTSLSLFLSMFCIHLVNICADSVLYLDSYVNVIHYLFTVRTLALFLLDKPLLIRNGFRWKTSKYATGIFS